MNFLQLVPTAAGYLASLILIASLPFRSKAIQKTLGNCLEPMRRGRTLKIYAMMALCLLVNSLPLIRSQTLLTSCIFSAVAVLGEEIAIRNLLVLKNGGLYQNGFFLQYPFVLFENILSVPALNWEDVNLCEKFDFQVILKENSSINLIFQNTWEAQMIIGSIKEKCPEIQR